ncbi:MAG: hypothetical protein R3191_01635 [Anaerolineales bacterium]|nr:hypothetical protein [Anaerolineales bacterium]
MTTVQDQEARGLFGLPIWFQTLLPLVLLGLMLSVFAFTNPLALFTAELPPIENLTIQQVRVVDDGFEMVVVNGGPEPVKVSQVLVDEAYWSFEPDPSNRIPPLGTATFKINYPWVYGEAHALKLITETGITFEEHVEPVVPTPEPDGRTFAAYGLLGIYVGVIPVALGMLWYPAMRRADRKWLSAILALTLGLLVFLFLDTLLEALEVAATLPSFLQGVALVLLAGLLTWMLLLAIGAREGRRQGVYLAALIALGIGFHNLGEGLAIGTAFALGEAALGSFLVIGFTLHNVTEGVGIAAPLVPELSEGESQREAPSLWTFVWLTLLAGAPAILGAWIGGFAYSPLLAALFLGIGTGAIWQVIADVGVLLKGYAEQRNQSPFTWLNVGAFTAGLAIMYLTAFLVAA